MSLRTPPHRISIWRRTSTGKSSYAEELSDREEVANDVEFDIQLGSGTVQQRAYGRADVGVYQAFADSGVDLQPDDVVRIDESRIKHLIGRSFQVTKAMDWGSKGGIQAEVIDNEEELPDEAS